MATNLALDDSLVAEAQRIGGHRTKREAVNAALEEYVNRRKQRKILELKNTLALDESYDYKKERKKR